MNMIDNPDLIKVISLILRRNHKFSCNEERLESTRTTASYYQRKQRQEFLNNLEDKEKAEKLRAKGNRISDNIMITIEKKKDAKQFQRLPAPRREAPQASTAAMLASNSA